MDGLIYDRGVDAATLKEELAIVGTGPRLQVLSITIRVLFSTRPRFRVPQCKYSLYYLPDVRKMPQAIRLGQSIRQLDRISG